LTGIQISALVKQAPHSVGEDEPFRIALSIPMQLRKERSPCATMLEEHRPFDIFPFGHYKTSCFGAFYVPRSVS